MKEWYNGVAAVVEELVQADRGRWERLANEPLGVFLSDSPSDEQALLRQREETIRRRLAMAFGELARTAKQRSRKQREIGEHASRGWPHKLPEHEYGAANLYDICGYYSRCEGEAIVGLADCFPVVSDSYYSGIDQMDVGLAVPKLGDFVSARVERRLSGLELLLAKLAYCTGLDTDEIWLLAPEQLATLESDVKALCEVLLHGIAAREARPYVVLAQVYLTRRAKPDISLWHVADESMAERWHRLSIAWLGSCTADVVDALRGVLDDLRYTTRHADGLQLQASKEDAPDDIPPQYDRLRRCRVLFKIVKFVWKKTRPVSEGTLRDDIWEDSSVENVSSYLTRINRFEPHLPFTLHKEGGFITKKNRADVNPPKQQARR